MPRFKPERAHYIPKGSKKVAHKHSSAVVYAHEREINGRKWFSLMGFAGRRQKPDFHFRYPSEEKRLEKANAYFADIQGREAVVIDRRAKPHELKVGDVLRSSWGYDQTNVDYYQVVALIGKSMVEIREIEGMAYESGPAAFAGQCVPAVDKFKGPAMRKRADGNSVRIYKFAHAFKIEPKIVAGVPVYESAYWSSYA